MDNAGDSSIERLGSSVCQVCQGLGDLTNPRGALVDIAEGLKSLGRYLYIYMHHPSVAALVRSAEAGCGICTVLCHGLRSSNITRFDEAAAAVSPALTTASTGAKSIADAERSDDEVATHLAELVKSQNSFKKLDLGHIGKGRITIQHSSNDKLGPRGSIGRFSIRAYVLNADSFYGFCSGFQTSYDQFDPELKHRPSRQLLSDPHIGLIKHWRDTCEENHASCRTTACDKQLPSRVLKLDLSKEDGVRLIETHGIEQGTLAYACLSYCWGVSKTQTGQTHRSNLKSHLQGISLNNLPSTVADTIRLCRKLEFQYLWVDRLCIIQDDEEDWAKEASKMCDIYSGSELTISAPICSESSQSFLEERFGRWLRKQSQSGILEFSDEKPNSKGSLWMRSGFYRSGPWVFEEDWREFCELMKDTSRWLGRGWTFQEWMLSPRVLHIDSMTIWDCFNGYANELNQRCMREAHLIRNPREFGRGISWESMVEEYSKRNIAYEKDRLPALAGLAERYRRKTGYTYLAGIWLEQMPISLLWQADPYISADRQPPANQTTPSWSWAHCNRPVMFVCNDWDSSSEALIKSHYCRYEPCSSISTVVEAWIDVDGSLGDVTSLWGRHNELRVEYQSWESFLDDEDWDMDDAVKQGNVKLLLLVSPKKGRHYGALVLHRCLLNDDGTWCFRRVGIANLRWPEWKQSFEEPLWKKQVVRLV